MRAHAIRPGAALAVILAAASPLHAQLSPGPSRSQGVTTARGVDARFRLPYAVEKAEREGHGRATSAEFTPFPQGGGALEITVMRADKSIVKYRVDANTGEVVNTTEQTVESYVSTLDPAALAAETYTMSQAIAAAEAKQPGGAAIGAEVQSKDGRTAYEVSVLKEGAETSFIVGTDGEATEN